MNGVQGRELIGTDGSATRAAASVQDREYEPGGRLSFAYVRRYHGVPAKRGGRVLFRGEPARITSGNGHYIRIRMDGEKRSVIVHPTWEMEYLDAD